MWDSQTIQNATHEKWVKLALITQNACDPSEMFQEISQGKREMGGSLRSHIAFDPK
jgi:hypothetical protein